MFYGGSSTGNGAYLYSSSNGTTISLGTLGGSDVSAAALNNKGQAVGTSYGAVQGYVAFVSANGSMFDLNKLLINAPPNLSLSGAIAINDQGQIIAFSNDRSLGAEDLYLLTPSNLPAPPAVVPEPSSWALFGFLFLAAAGGLGRMPRSS